MHTVIGLKPSAGVCPLHYEGRLFESSATLSKPLRRSGGSSHKSCLLFICKITFKQSFNNASVTKIFEAYSSWKMYVHNNNVVQIVQQDTVLFFLWFSKCVFLIMWKCLCSLVKTSSCFNANNQHNDLHMFVSVLRPAMSFLRRSFLTWWPQEVQTKYTIYYLHLIGVTQFPIFLYLPIYTIWWLLPYQNHLHF